MKKFIAVLIFLLQLSVLVSCEDRGLYDVSFSYAGIIDKEYRFNVGRVIPVTIGQSIETDGDISADGKYFYYTSNMDDGNFDIYLREMSDITTVRLTGHPSKDTNPVISPDGKTLAFVSFREDPEGDIYTVGIDPDKLVEKGRDTTASTDTIDADVVNITAERDPESEVIINGRDANPAWSPDGKWLACSSTRNGSSDIWIMKPNGKKRTKIVTGGDYPSFSQDGSKIVFISYRDSSDGDLYVADIESGKTERITSSQGIKLYPVFAGGNDEVIYSLIENDTNKNGKLDLQDRSFLCYMNKKRGMEYRLTRESVSSFKAKWLPSVKTRDYKGIILYTDITDENINLNIIPETGIIPKKQNAKLQSEFAFTYLEEYDDSERYAMALESVYFFFGGNTDNSSRTYVDRSLGLLAQYYVSEGRKRDAAKIIALIKKRSDKNPYASMHLKMAENALAGRKIDRGAILSGIISDRDKGIYVPYAMEDIADSYFASGEVESASAVYRDIIKRFPDFERALDINSKISLCDDDLRSGMLSASAEKVLNSGTVNQRISVIRNLLSVFEQKNYPLSETGRYIKRVLELQAKYRDNNKILPVLKYVTALLYDRNGQADEAEKELAETLKIAPQNDIVNHLSSMLMGDIQLRSGKPGEAEKYYSEGVNTYARRFRTAGFKEKVLWLVDYYEQTGIRLSSSGRPGDASKNHEKNILLLTRMHNKRLFPEVYTEYAARAHILYIDSYLEWKGEKSITDLENKYNNDSNKALFKMDFDRAAIYGIAYVFTRKALYLQNNPPVNPEANNAELVMQSLVTSVGWIEWALFIDDKFIEPYVLKSWIYQFVDYARSTGDEHLADAADRFFPGHLWEKNIPILEKALTANDESKSPENEGNIHLNMGNSYYLLLNYPRALKHYQLAEKYKKRFGSEIEQALFYFHTGYCYWQNSEIGKAREAISRAYEIYRSLGAGRESGYANQYLVLYRYFALFSRYEGKYGDAIKWYGKILEHANKYKLVIDRARYMQEIAHCYIELGDTSAAASYIAQASELLKSYPDDERKSYLKWWFFGLGPFEFYDVGSDTLVIGDSSIYYSLDTFGKKMLNVSMLEDISLRNNDYDGAIKHLKNKIKMASDKDTGLAAEIIIRSLNNLGYYYFLSRDLVNAEKYFGEAAKKATEKNNLDGIFTSAMNMVNLYSMMIEENSDPSRDWEKVTGRIIKQISVYRESYRELRLQKEMEDLEEKAKAKKRDVSDEEKEEAVRKVDQETTEIYYSLDVAVSIIKFYRAEILYSKIKPGKKENESAYKLYTDNREISGLYADALQGFEAALPVAESRGNQELKCKLLINSAVCYERRGDNEKAYVALLDARTIAEKYELRWLKIASNHALGSFLQRSGREVEKGDYNILADKYMSSAIDTAEEHPLLVASHANRVRQLYREYTDFLISAGRSEKAFTVSERYSQFCRVTLVNAISPAFKNSYDRKMYYDYLAALTIFSSTENGISDLLKSGSKPDSEALMALRKKKSDQQADISEMYGLVLKRNRLVASYLELSPVSIPDSGYDLYRFHDTPKGLFYWRVSGKKIASGYAGSEGIDGINRVIGKNETTPVFILPGEGTVALLKGGVVSRPYSVISGLDRVDYYLADKNPLTGDIISSVPGLSISADQARVDGWDVRLNPADYGIIVSSAGTGTPADPKYLFASGISPACIVLAGYRDDYNSVLLVAEAALYNGTARIVFTDGKAAEISYAVNRMYKKDAAGHEFTAMVYGYIKTMLPGDVDNKKLAGDEYRYYEENLARNDLVAARIHLSRWYSFSGRTSKERYTVNLWMISLLAGKYGEAADIIKQMNPATPEEKTASNLMNIYQLLYTGRVADAEKEFLKNRSETGSGGDTGFLDAIFELAVKGNIGVIKKVASFNRPYNTVLPAGRYMMLLFQYAALIDKATAFEAAGLIPAGSALSEGELLQLMLLADRSPGPGYSVRFDRILGIAGHRDNPGMLADAVKGNVTGDEGFDRLSVYTVMLALKYYIAGGFSDKAAELLGTIEIRAIAESAEPLDALLLLKTAQEVAAVKGEYGSALAAIEEMKKYKGSAPFIEAWIYSASAKLLSISGEYRDAYEAGMRAEGILAAAGHTDTELSLLMINILVITGQFDEAQRRAELITAADTFTAQENFLFRLQRTLIELYRLGKLKSATTADAVLFEKLFMEILDALKKDPSLASRPGTDVMVGIVFDEYINYRMKTGNYGDAHLVNEMKKIVFASALSGVNMVRLAEPLTVDGLQALIPGGSVYVNVSKIRDDIFIWIMDGRDKKALIIPGGYTQVVKILERFESEMSAGRDVSAVSRELNALFQPMFSVIDRKSNVIFCCDSFTEKIPFEIAGDASMFCEDHNVMFIASPFMMKGKPALKTDAVKVLSYDKNSQTDYLERAAIMESGASCNLSGEAGGGIVHIAGKISYSMSGRAFADPSGRSLLELAKGADLLYMSPGKTEGSSVTSLVLAASSVSNGAVVVNSAPVNDTNRAVFVHAFYSGVINGTGPEKSFRAASNKLISGRYRHPSFWRGLRIYVRSFSGI